MSNLSLKLKDLRKNKKKKKGFTLVELIIVIAIMAILAAVAIPRFGEVTRNANITADIATAKNIHGVAAQILAENATITDADLQNAVAARMDGGTMPTSRTQNQVFSITFDATGDIQVFSGAAPTGTTTGATAANQVYPAQGTDFTK